MNKTAIKNFAVWARTKLRDDIKIRAGFLGINEDGVATPLPASTPEIKYFEVGSAQPIALSGENLRRRERIVDKLKKKTSETDYKTAYDLMIETYASDWFNRFVALRFMEVNERFADNMRVLSSSNPDRHDPDIVSQPFSSDLEFTDAERADITEWKAKNETDKLFRFLLIKRCNQLSKVLPGLFEAKGDESELMMRQSFIDKDGIIYRLVNDIDEEDWKDQVQIIGWLYQYYNSELKDETFALAKKGKKITKERVPSATQLFTPDWIVRYMAENYLGRLWIEGHTTGDWSEESEKSAADEFGWKYYLPEARQEPEVEKQLGSIRAEYSKLNPEELTFIDPSMGSGHVLVYAFDVLMQIYESVGYTRRDAARSIVENNIYGLDIDDRAYQLACFAVMMKACEYDGRFLERGVSPHVYSITESNDINRNQLKFFGAGLSDIEKNNAMNQASGLLDTFIDSKEYGSILNVENYDWELLTRFADGINDDGQMSLETIGIDIARKEIKSIVEIGRVLSKKYWITCTNPPYMGLNSGNSKLTNYVKQNYLNYKSDLFSVFIKKCNELTQESGLSGMITQHAWMFLASFENMRKEILSSNIIVNMAHLGLGAFEDLNSKVVQTTAFIIKKIYADGYSGSFSKLFEKQGIIENTDKKIEWFFDGKHRRSTCQRIYSQIPGSPIAYWISDSVVNAFANNEKIEEYADPKQGLATADNDRFLRLWFEVALNNTFWTCTSHDDAQHHKEKWYPYNKGGDFRKWYGNNGYLINWQYDGSELHAFKGSVLRSPQFYFKDCGSWSKVTSAGFSMRYVPKGFLFDVAGCSLFDENDKRLFYIIGFLNSKVSQQMLNILSPALNYEVGHVSKMPLKIDLRYESEIVELVKANIDIAREDWDSFETSWDFFAHPLVTMRGLNLNTADEEMAALNNCMNDLKANSLIEMHWMKYQEECECRFNVLKANEERLNSLFIDIYNLQDEITPEEADVEITIRKADLTREIKSLISYAVGCMFGRYSLDVGGLVHAGGNWDSHKYTIFQPDADNVIPITDARYLGDDIVDRFCDWLTVVYGEESLEENLIFIANALGTKGTDSRDIIRNYFLNDFFKDHCQTYSVTGSGKRPIYWLFDSGKQNGFKALVYMHRYNADTIGRVRISYLHPLQEKYENEVRTIDTMIQSMTDQRQISAEEKRREKLIKQIAEVKEYDERLDHLAQEHIDIDLDDGVKVNYEKIQTDRDGKKYQILAPIK